MDAWGNHRGEGVRLSKYPYAAWRLWDGRRYPQLPMLCLAVNRKERSLAVAEPGEWAMHGDKLTNGETWHSPARWWPEFYADSNPETLIVADDAAAALVMMGIFEEPCGWDGWERKWWILRDPPVHVVMAKGKQRCHIVSAQSIWPKWAAQGSPRTRARQLHHDLTWWRDTLHANGLGPLRPSMSMQARQALSLSRSEDTLLQGPEGLHHALAGECSLRGMQLMPRGPGTWKDCYALDLRSCYPSIMAHRDLGCGPASTARTVSMDRLLQLVYRQPTIARVKLNVPVPKSMQRRIQIVAAAPDPGWTTLATPELRTALHAGAIEKIGRVCTYIKGKPLQAVAKRLLALRDVQKAVGTEDGRHLAKALANRIYGSLSQPKRSWMEIGEAHSNKVAEWSEYVYRTHQQLNYRAEGGKVYMATESGWPRLSAPWASAHIASWGRVWLDELCAVAGDALVYADTDGLIVERHGLAKVVAHAEANLPAMLTLEAEGTCTVHAYRRYEIGDRVRQSGTKLVQVLDAKEHTITRQSTAQSIISNPY